jgi:hypothetical protein
MANRAITGLFIIAAAVIFVALPPSHAGERQRVIGPKISQVTKSPVPGVHSKARSEEPRFHTFRRMFVTASDVRR